VFRGYVAPERGHSHSTVHVEGGARRGTGKNLSIVNYRHRVADPLVDILKALCLGATAVGIGRPFLYAQSVSLAFGLSAV